MNTDLGRPGDTFAVAGDRAILVELCACKLNSKNKHRKKVYYDIVMIFCDDLNHDLNKLYK